MSARRVLQGGVAFAAFGALSLASAVPAHAENGELGFAEANVAGEGRILGFYPRGGDVGGYGGPLYEGEVFSDSINSILVDVEEDQLRARVMFRELRIELTEADVAAMRAAAEDGVSQPGLENPDPEADGSKENGSDSEEVVLRASFTDTDIKVTQNWAGEREFSHNPGTESVEVNELGAELSFSTETAAWHETREDQALIWQDLDPEQELWGGIQTLDLVVTFPDEGFSVSYEVGEAIVASDTEPEAPGEDGDPDDGETGGDGSDDGTGGGDDGPGTGDEDGDTGEGGQDGDTDGEGDPGKGEEPADEDGRDTAEDAAEEGAENDPEDALARTGSPVVGLIAAGAAIAAGGGAATYLARRRKTASAPDEGPDEG
ncbi:hypothetical protein HNR06_002446 [Nocardiopsis arvandica]|uniref:Cell wall protein n=1 Tax=Nocardiopsis sinuspersici TaxID=501010 RepID=A0A7Y9XDG7_9ACTN|nr:hypothetical protein [Nocardiopsis sinuspersici]